jgi:hypothetical protein
MLSFQLDTRIECHGGQASLLDHNANKYFKQNDLLPSQYSCVSVCLSAYRGSLCPNSGGTSE